MTEVEVAQKHLEQALRRLESAVARRVQRPPGDAGGNDGAAFAELAAERDHLARDVSALRHECDRLSGALSEAQHDNRTLREVTGQVAERLDRSIAEIDRLLGS